MEMHIYMVCAAAPYRDEGRHLADLTTFVIAVPHAANPSTPRLVVPGDGS
jgi:hypothetical protein